MSKKTSELAKNLIWGSLVADAAAMGLHWIYDQEHIQKIAPSEPEFREPEEANYKGVPGFFAHENRSAGEQSQYGEQVLVMLRSLVSTDGQFDVNHYSQGFRNHFGYGGSYVGYIDRATRETLNNFIRAEDEAHALAQSIPYSGEPSVTNFLTGKAMAISNLYGHDIVRKKFEEAVRIKYNDDSIVKYALQILEKIQSMETLRGAHDEQFPATAKLPPLIAITMAKEGSSASALTDSAEMAIKVTNTHENALTYGRTCVGLMEAAMQGKQREAIVDAGIQTGTTDISTAIESALARGSDTTVEVTKHFGMACDLKFGVPSIVHNIATADSFEDAIRQNIYAGGDTCGRSIILGAVLGALYGIGGKQGIPEQWVNALTAKSEVENLLTKALGN